MASEVNMHELQIKASELIHSYKQRKQLASEKKVVDKQYLKAEKEMTDILKRLNKKAIRVDNKYEISLIHKSKKRSMNLKERQEYIDNISNMKLEPHELSQNIKDALNGDVEFVDKISITEI